SQQNGVDHDVLSRAGVDGHAGDVHFGGGGVEVLVLDGASGAAVHGVGVLGPETHHVKVVGALSDLLVGGQGHADGAVGNLPGQQPLTQGHDLGDTRLVVGPQQGGAVGSDEGLALQVRQEGELLSPDDPALPGQSHVAAVVVFMEDGV